MYKRTNREQTNQQNKWMINYLNQHLILVSLKMTPSRKQDVSVKHHVPAKGLFLDNFGVTGKC